MNKYIHQTLFVTLSLAGCAVLGQTVNEGQVFVLPNTEVSTLSDFENKEGAVFYNDGTLYVYRNFTNNGLFDFTSNRKTGYTLFKGLDAYKQKLEGAKPTKFFDVLFDNPTPDFAFDLETDINIAGTANFYEGVLNMEHQQAALLFLPGSKAINASDQSYAHGMVEKEGNNEFIFPIGKEGYYRKAAIGAPQKLSEVFYAEYFIQNSDDLHPHQSRAGVIEWINDKEYWTIDAGEVNSSVILALSWHDKTTPEKLLQAKKSAIHIVRWDEEQQLWVDEGGIADESTQTVTTPTRIDKYGIFTLGLVNEELLLEGDVVVYNAVSPNGDGYNDYFRIDNIQRYPNNKVEIYNRWGVLVYETTSYDSKGNVFEGISEGRVTMNKNEKLPSGTYYYVLSYEYNDDRGSKTIKKSGYLHLEND